MKQMIVSSTSENQSQSQDATPAPNEACSLAWSAVGGLVERFFLCYLVFNFVASKCEPAKLRRGDSISITDADDTTDHACHLGGAILGFGFGACWYVYHQKPIHQKEKQMYLFQCVGC